MFVLQRFLEAGWYLLFSQAALAFSTSTVSGKRSGNSMAVTAGSQDPKHRVTSVTKGSKESEWTVAVTQDISFVAVGLDGSREETQKKILWQALQLAQTIHINLTLPKLGGAWFLPPISVHNHAVLTAWPFPGFYYFCLWLFLLDLMKGSDWGSCNAMIKLISQHKNLICLK